MKIEVESKDVSRDRDVDIKENNIHPSTLISTTPISTDHPYKYQVLETFLTTPLSTNDFEDFFSKFEIFSYNLFVNQSSIHV